MTTDPPTESSGLTAFFETRTAAEEALDRLRSAGVPDVHLRLTEGTGPNDAPKPPGAGALDKLGAFPMPRRDAQAGDGCRVTVSGLPADRRDLVARLLHEAGGVGVADRAGRGPSGATEPAAARPVQPGFADPAPGFVPDAAEFPPTRIAGEGQAPDEVGASKGRFAEQLDRLPEGRAERGTSGKGDDPTG